MPHDRYSRHALIGWFSQELVQRARFIVVGAGAIGNEVIKNLALLGAGHLAIHDLDRIEVHNLTRSVLFRESDVGRHKAEVAAARARELDPAVDAVAVPGDIRGTLGFDALRRADCVIGCLDNFEARIRLSRLCRLAGANLVDVAIDTRHASIEVFPFAARPDCACYECTLPPGVYARMARRYSCAGLLRRGLAERRIPTTIVTSSAAGALAVSAAMRLLHAPGRALDEAAGASRVVLDTVAGTSSPAPLSRNAACPGCGDLHGTVRIVACDPVVGPPRTLKLPAGATLRLSDAVVAGGTCGACGHRLDARLRLVRDHDEGLADCPGCGAGGMQLDVRDQFTAAELWAGHPGEHIPARFALLDAGDTTVVLDFGGACQSAVAAASGV